MSVAMHCALRAGLEMCARKMDTSSRFVCSQRPHKLNCRRLVVVAELLSRVCVCARKICSRCSQLACNTAHTHWQPLELIYIQASGYIYIYIRAAVTSQPEQGHAARSLIIARARGTKMLRVCHKGANSRQVECFDLSAACKRQRSLICVCACNT